MTQKTPQTAPTADEILELAVSGGKRVREIAQRMMAAGVGRQQTTGRSSYSRDTPQTASPRVTPAPVPGTRLRVIIGGRP